MARPPGRWRSRGAFDGAIAEARATPPTRPPRWSTRCPTTNSPATSTSASTRSPARRCCSTARRWAGAHAERGLAVARGDRPGPGAPRAVLDRHDPDDARAACARPPRCSTTAIEIARVAGHDQGMAWNLFAARWPRAPPATARPRWPRRARASTLLRGMRAQLPGHRRRPRAGGRAARRRRRRRRARSAARGRRRRRRCARSPAAWRARALELLTRIVLALGRPRRRGRGAAQAWRDGCRRSRPRDAAALQLGAGGDGRTGAARRRRSRSRAGDAAPAGAARATSRLALRGRVHRGRRAGRGRRSRASLAGRALAAAGDTERAAAELERAAAEFERCGALGHRDAASASCAGSAAAAATGARARSATARSIESLTERELQIARLVVDRRTNAEIAAELYLSTKTVETHLRNLFHKLGVSSRVEVARVVERADASAAAAVSSGAPGRARSGAG